MNKQVHENSISDLLKKFDIEIKDYSIYRLAFTHGSFDKKNIHNNYQKLEFLGDAIIEFIVSEYLFKNLSDFDQGQLTILRSQVVKTQTLSQITHRLGLTKFCLTGFGMTHDEVLKSTKVAADIYESLVAAIFIDSGLEKAKKFVINTLESTIKQLKNFDVKDPKSKFQEYIQGQGMSKNPVHYENVNIGSQGFEAKVIHDGIIFGIGKGKSKNEAEQNAALDALGKLVGK
ncbi:ribonuclease III [Mycoplasmopsis hyopharyngis]|uniref:ribonuclease III n=1 Tax=Mycoplasmopsis hyopharyngis TaxID=29558 RepID=UPI003872D339